MITDYELVARLAQPGTECFTYNFIFTDSRLAYRLTGSPSSTHYILVPVTSSLQEPYLIFFRFAYIIMPILHLETRRQTEIPCPNSHTWNVGELGLEIRESVPKSVLLTNTVSLGPE